MSNNEHKKTEAVVLSQNIKPRIIWLLSKLIFNLFAWNILVRIFIFLNYLINPEIGETGAKVFQAMHQNGLILTAMASLVAVSSWLFEDIMFYKHLAKKSLGVLFVWRIVFVVILLVVVFLAISIYHYHAKIIVNASEYLTLIKWFFLNKTTLYLFSVGILISSFINFYKAIRQKVGFENFYPIISGYYRTPREEDRIFIFIDLISSTRYAELLGHRKYSAFLQECFKHLGILEIKYRAMQYQIVGDEVVLSWPSDKKRNFRYAVNFYFEFTSILSSHADYFLKEFGVVPNFTASINKGKIMVSEVGTLKSEIAFHGDVLNTAARIQKQCKSYNKPLLVTKAFAEAFHDVSEGYKIELETEGKMLIGKQKPVDIYSIEEEQLKNGKLTHQLPFYQVINSKNNGRQNKPIHKNIIGHAKQFIFASQ
jgi:adenylate cyclase